MPTTPKRFHLAQANYGVGIALPDDPVMKGFMDQLDYVNGLADQAPGFVWRLKSEAGDSTSFRVFDDPRILVTMSVWESPGDLFRFVYESNHRLPLKKRRKWFQKLTRPTSVLWWIPAGELPALEHLQERFGLLERSGPTPSAFTFGTLFDPEGRAITRADIGRAD